LKLAPSFCALLVLLGGTGLAAQTAGFYPRARALMAEEAWYSASEILMENLRTNPAHAEGTFALAECLYELGEFDQALHWVQRARVLARTDMAVANLQAVTLIALGELDAAAETIAEILAREPNNREALFASGELDIARGRPADALARFSGALGRFPDDRRLLLSLALVSSALGQDEAAISFINRAAARHPDDYRVFFHSARVHAKAGRTEQALQLGLRALHLRPDYAPTRALLGNLRYVLGDFSGAADLANEAIAADREDMGAWYLRGLSFMRMGMGDEAIAVLGNAVAINPSDEFVRIALDEALLSGTALEDPRRKKSADWYFGRARDLRARNLISASLLDYRRGLRLDPFSPARAEYADLLRLQGYPARFVDELMFLRHLGLESPGESDTVEAFGSTIAGSLAGSWNLVGEAPDGRHWKLAVFSGIADSTSRHVDSSAIAASLVKELLIHDRNIVTVDIPLRQASFAAAFRAAREAGADYFLLISGTENERDFSVRAELFVARTGSPAETVDVFRTGPDRLRNAAEGVLLRLGTDLPFRGRLLQRRQSEAVIDKGRAEGVRVGDVFEIVQKDRAQVLGQGIGLAFDAEHLLGILTITEVDERISAGTITRDGFFDRIEAGDEALLRNAGPGGLRRQELSGNPELGAMLRTLR